MSSKITIAIDGFSSTGKSTIAKQLAKQLGYIYVDTGAMYRAVTLYALQHNFIKNKTVDVSLLTDDLDSINIGFQYNPQLGFSEVYLNDVNVEAEVRGMEVSAYVSKVAEISKVRRKLVALQQQMGKNKGIVMDGRDIGTVVFPDAELKLFIKASATTRAQRRFDEMIAKGNTKVTFEEVYQNISQRDEIDTTRKDSPLKKAEDAVEIDNSSLSKKQQFDKILSLVKSKV